MAACEKRVLPIKKKKNDNAEQKQTGGEMAVIASR